MTSLPEPSFIERDAAQIQRECIAFIEDAVTGVGRPLAPSGYERALVDLVVYRETLLRIAIQLAALQNLPAYAVYPMLDHLVAIAGGARLAAQPATTTIQWTLPAPALVAQTVPAGTAVRSKDGKATFSTDADLEIVAGATTASVSATCTAPGLAGNGYGVGQVSELVAALPFTATASNTTVSEDGAPSELTERLRERLPLLVRGSSVAGPEDAYARLARGAHPDVLEVKVRNVAQFGIQIVVLGRNGAPSGGVLAAVVAACNPKDVRPMNDLVTSIAATPVDYAITCSVIVRKGYRDTDVLPLVQAALSAYAAERAGGLSRAPVREQIIGVITSVPGVYSTTLTSPAATPAVSELEWARCTAITATFASFATGD